MIKSLFYLLVSFSFINHCSGQEVTIKGKLKDTTENHFLSNAVISLLQNKDSFLFSFCRTDTNGEFKLTNVAPGSYFLLITFPKFADYTENISMKDAGNVDLGTIYLTLKSILLKEVFIRANRAIRIKGDTTEFAADSFKVKDGATVEDLLKKLPGFTVNSSGEITAQGKTVDKVLVDGEEFFGNDPTMATQNISAKAVKKVQLFDTKTEQQELKGISNGSDGKTVNISLKDEMKKGTFGRVGVGSNFSDILDAKLLFHNFAGLKKLSLYAIKSNTNAGSLGKQDFKKLGLLNSDMDYDEINDYYVMVGSSSNDEFNDWSSRGLPEAFSAGGLYINKWNIEKHAINSSYTFNRLKVFDQTNIHTQNILPHGLYYTNQNTNTKYQVQQHVGNIKYGWNLNSLSSLKYTAAVVFKTAQSNNNTYSSSLNQDSLIINNNYRINDNNKVRKQFDNALTYKQLFKKKGRQLITTTRLGVIIDQQTSILRSFTSYYQNNNFDHGDSIDQQKLINGNSISSGIKFTYSDPITTQWTMIIESIYNQNNSSSQKNTFDKDNSGKYEQFNPLYSNRFKLKAFSGTAALFLKYNYKKWKAAIGSGISNIKLKLYNIDSGNMNIFHFAKLTPQAQLGHFDFTKNLRISITYRGTTVQPTIDQLQPSRDNHDPINIFIGNPNLKVSFNHSLTLNYNSFKPLSGVNLYVESNFTIINNAITYAHIIDSFGKGNYTPINVKGNQNWNLYCEFRHGIGEKLIYGINIDANGGKSIQIINGKRGITRYGIYQTRVSLGYNLNNKFHGQVEPELSYNRTQTSFGQNVQNSFFTYGGKAEGFVNFHDNFELNTDVDLNLREQTIGFNSNTNFIKWNAGLSKKIFKKKGGKIIFQVNDILDQNKGINRTINSSFISEETFLRRSRYFILRIELTLDKMASK